MTHVHHLKSKAVWNSTHEQIKADMKWHTLTLLRTKKSKEEDYLKKGSTTHCNHLLILVADPGVMQWESYSGYH